VTVGTGTDRSGREYVRDGARVVELPGRGRAGRWAQELRALVERDGPYDVVHALEADAALAAAQAGCPVVFTVLGLPRGTWLAERPSYRAELREVGRAAAVTCALTRVAADAVAAAAELAHVQVLPPGLRAEHFPLSTAPRGVDVLFASVLDEERKRFAALVAALEDVPRARLVVAGGGDASAALAAHPRVAARTRVLTGVDRASLPGLYAAAAVTALPSVDEAFGLVVVESLACGTPVLAAPGSGPEELLAGAQVGVVDDDLAAGLRRLLDDPPDPARCREHALRWDWSRVGPAHDDVWRRAAG
jgi:glycosyltransferase involved in cell wall biosynthesis